MTPTKPQNILDLEKLLRIELQEHPSDGTEDFLGLMSKSFKRNDNNEIIELCLWSCELEDVSFLEKFSNIQSLYLSDNKISDISSLKTLSDLWILNLGDNQISDISALQNLVNLRSLNVKSNQITDISPIQNLVNLTSLRAIENKITNISALSKLTNLIQLDLGFNQISDIGEISKITNLSELYLNSNRISDISELQNLTNLTSLLLHRNPIVDITPLQNFTNFTRLNLSYAKIIDITPLKGLTNLKLLDLFENEITDISPLQNLVNLKELYIFNNKILDITVLQYLENLENLSIYNNQIVDVRPVLGLKKIRQMDLWSNPIYYLLPENLRNAGWSSIKKYFLQYKDNWAALRKKILFTMAQPTDVVVLKTPKEFARIQAAIQKSNLLDIEYFYSMGVNLLTEKITINQYNIFHFAGHGNKDTIFLEAADGTHAPISWRNLAGTLAKSTSKFDLVFLNSDYSVSFANITTKNIRYKILIKETLGEDSAILFSQNFYNALGERYDIERAFVKARKILILHTYAEAHKIPIELITEHENAYNAYILYENNKEIDLSTIQDLDFEAIEDNKLSATNTAKSTQYTHSSDSVKGEDSLGISADVNAFARLIVSESLTPPLAIGLFGQWGSGKSFFMKKMEERIDKIKENQGVVQVHFNAWHYAEENLWASLVAAIFKGLISFAKPELKEEDNPFLVYKNLEKEINDLDTKIQKEQQKLDSFDAEQEKKQKELLKDAFLYDFPASVLEELKKDAKFKELYNELSYYWKGYENVNKDVESIKKTIDALKNLAEQATEKPWLAIRIAFKQYIMLIIVGFTIWGCTLYINWNEVHSLFTKTILTISFYAAPVIALLKGVYDCFITHKDFVTRFTDIAGKLNEEITTESKKNKDGKEQVEKDLQKSKTDKKNKEIELNKIANGERLLKFILDPEQLDKYERALGIINMIRNDFTKISKEVEGITSIENERKIKSSFKIDKIILYIDDLDRCQPDRVVEILEAVHLLMGLEGGLFITVVGVDPRWVVESLQCKYADLLDKDNTNTNTKAKAYDYLEKIFQIPFRIQPLDEDMKATYLEQLIPIKQNITPAPKSHSKTENTDAAPNPTDKNSVNNSADTGKKTEDVADSKTEEVADSKIEKVTISKTVENLIITQEELDWIKSLSPLLGSQPRNIKRFVNIYKLLRAHDATKDFSEDTKTDFQAIMLLLAIANHHTKEDFDRFTKNVESIIHYLLDTDEIDTIRDTFKNTEPFKSLESETILKHKNLVSKFIFRG